MKAKRMPVLALAAVVIAGLLTAEAGAQTGRQRNVVEFERRNLGGPRLGVTYVLQGSEFIKALEAEDMGRVISQFGWHFEYQVIPEGGGPQFVIQFVPLIGGVEYGKAIPTFVLPMGIRFPGGVEFGMGPMAQVTTHGISTALVISVGKSFDYSGVSIPVNLVLTRNNDGVRISTIFGYAIRKLPSNRL